MGTDIDYPMFTDQEAADILCTALYGNDWATDYTLTVLNHIKTEYGKEPTSYRFAPMTRMGAEKPKNPEVTKESLHAAAMLVIENKVKVRDDIRESIIEEREATDCDGADVLLQISLFGKLIYC